MTVLTLMNLAVALAIAAALQTPATAFERAAAEAERFVDAGCVLYDRAGESRLCDAQAGTSLRGPYPVADLVTLTRHADPKVRTLALLQLFATGDPKLLPDIFALTRDTAETFPAHTPVAMLMPGTFKDVPKTPQKVGDVAEGMVRFYLERAGYEYGSAGVSGCPGFDDYWRQRKDRTRLASWFTVQLDRATQGTTPIPANRESRFNALRAAVERLDGDDRLWYRCWSARATAGIASSANLKRCRSRKRSDPIVSCNCSPGERRRRIRISFRLAGRLHVVRVMPAPACAGSSSSARRGCCVPATPTFSCSHRRRSTPCGRSRPHR